MKVTILDRALDDIEDGYFFYQEKSDGAGDYFLDTIWSDIDSLRYFAGVHPVIGRFYRMLTHRFPHAVYYKINGLEVSVQAVVDCRP